MPNIRPDHLPDYADPPLHEVVLGVQFSSPKGYQQIRAGEVWQLFKGKYPIVQEHQALEPQFETFGILDQRPGGQLSFVTGALHDRFWFVQSDNAELIQFQKDRLLHNWRRTSGNAEYPRFEGMIVPFEQELDMLQTYFASLGSDKLAITQCEISYINHIVPPQGAPIDPSEWIKGFEFVSQNVENFSVATRERLTSLAGKPIGRLFLEANSGQFSDEKRFIALTLTVRGTPAEPTISSAVEFLTFGRELIVNRFTEVTTDSAHNMWKRIK